MAILGNLDFRVTENNGGGIALAIKEDNHFIYIHSGYENIEGQLIEDIKALFDGQHPSQWDGDELSEFKEFLEGEGLEGDDVKSPLTQGRELKLVSGSSFSSPGSRPSRRGVN